MHPGASNPLEETDSQRMNSHRTSTHKTALTLVFAIGCLLTAWLQPAKAQYTTTPQDPYVDGVLWTAPQAAPTQPPLVAPGSGDGPPAVNPGMTGPAELMPWNTNIPANTIDQSTTQLNLPSDPTTLTAPGTLGPSLSGSIPPPPSNPAAAPGMLQAPQGQNVAAANVNIGDGGAWPGDEAPTTRTGRQSTQDFGLLRQIGSQANDYGYPVAQNPDLASGQTPQKSDDQPLQATYVGSGTPDSSTVNSSPNLPNAFYVNMGTGLHTQFQGANQQTRQTIAPY
jgi:hypothetical protein